MGKDLSMSRRALFTHNDLDALTSALLARLAMPDCDVFFCTYDRFPELIARRGPAYDVIWVADLSMKSDSPEMAALRSMDAEVSWYGPACGASFCGPVVTAPSDRS